MEVKLQIPFQQLLNLVKKLSPKEKAQLKKKLEKSPSEKKDDDFINFLMQGPVYSEKEIATIEENRKSITEWRKKV